MSHHIHLGGFGRRAVPAVAGLTLLATGLVAPAASADDPIPTTAALAIAPSPSTYGTAVALTLTVSPTMPGPVLSGFATFTWTGRVQPVTIPLVNGSATEVVTLPVSPGLLITGNFTPSESAFAGSVANALTVVDKATVGISFTPMSSVVVGAVQAVQATVGNSAAATITNATPAVCTLGAGNTTVTANALGTCTLTASYAGDGNYNPAAPVTNSFQVVRSATSLSYAAASGVVGQPFTVNPSYSGFRGTPKFTATGLPAGLAINASTGVISGVPTAATPAGGQTGSVTATDSVGNTSTAGVRITVVPAPVVAAVSYPQGAGQVGKAIGKLSPTVTVLVKPVKYSVKGLPAGLKFSKKTGAITGTPTTAGSFAPTVTAKGAKKSGTATTQVQLTISPSPIQAYLDYADGLTTAGVALRPMYPHYGGLFGTKTFTAKGLPGGVKINKKSGVISGTPKVVGHYTAIVTVKTKQSSATDVVTIVVNAPALPPTLSYPQGQLVLGKPMIPMYPSAHGMVGTVTYKATGLPAGVTISAKTGVISGKPTQAGLFVATVTAKASNGTAPATVLMQVLAP